MRRRTLAWWPMWWHKSHCLSSRSNLSSRRGCPCLFPSHLVQLDALPLTPNGKIDRRALLAPADVAQTHRDEFVPPRDHVEIQLAALWEQVLNVHPVGVTQGFFDLGGHSLLAVQLIAGIRARFGVELPVSTLFQHDTVEAL